SNDSLNLPLIYSFMSYSFFVYGCCCDFFFFFYGTATTEIYTLSLHDALPILKDRFDRRLVPVEETHQILGPNDVGDLPAGGSDRSEEHTSELQSRENLVCRLLLEKKKKINN